MVTTNKQMVMNTPDFVVMCSKPIPSLPQEDVRNGLHATKIKKLRNGLFALFIIEIAISLLISTTCHQENEFEAKLISTVNSILENEGECVVDLSTLITEFEWDTVSIFVGGNPTQIRENLKIDTDISDGIVFSLKGEPVMVATSTYQFPKDTPPTVGYSIERTNADDPYYVNLSADNASVLVIKYVASDGRYCYTLSPYK